jgi:hypothetical protein
MVFLAKREEFHGPQVNVLYVTSVQPTLSYQTLTSRHWTFRTFFLQQWTEWGLLKLCAAVREKQVDYWQQHRLN